MTKTIPVFIALILFAACAALTETSMTKEKSVVKDNPLLQEWDTPFGVPPFASITTDHYLPAFKASIKEARAEVDAIVNNADTPTFPNTIEALEAAGMQLDRVENVFYGLNDLLADDKMQAIAREAAPLRTEFYDDVSLNAELFQRVKAVYEQKDQLDLNTEQQTLLQRTWEDFVRGGANLDGEQKTRFREINKDLALLSLKFGDNVLAENNRYELVIDNEADLAGLTDNVIATAAETATSRGHEGKWVFTIHKPSMLPFLTYSQKRDLREQIFTAYITKGDHGDELDNNEIVQKTVSLRVERANLLGFPTHADFVEDVKMSKTPQNVYDLLDQLWTPAQNRAKTEVADMQDIIDAEGGGFKLEPWDWWYYAEKVKQSKYDLDDELLRQYFKLTPRRSSSPSTTSTTNSSASISNLRTSSRPPSMSPTSSGVSRLPGWTTSPYTTPMSSSTRSRKPTAPTLAST
jgi:peptidyl-dipeptidase Dcp